MTLFDIPSSERSEAERGHGIVGNDQVLEGDLVFNDPTITRPVEKNQNEIKIPLFIVCIKSGEPLWSVIFRINTERGIEIIIKAAAIKVNFHPALILKSLRINDPNTGINGEIIKIEKYKDI